MNEALQDFDPMSYEERIARTFYNDGGGLLTWGGWDREDHVQ